MARKMQWKKVEKYKSQFKFLFRAKRQNISQTATDVYKHSQFLCVGDHGPLLVAM